MCGAKTKLFKTLIESTEMNVCRECSKFGKVIAEVKEPEKPKTIKKIIKDAGPQVEILQVIAEDYAKKIKDTREKLGLNQKDFAKKINEKQALIRKIETDNFEPNISLARKLEKFLKIRLIEQHEEIHEKSAKTESSAFTIGDFIKVKKR